MREKPTRDVAMFVVLLVCFYVITHRHSVRLDFVDFSHLYSPFFKFSSVERLTRVSLEENQTLVQTGNQGSCKG